MLDQQDNNTSKPSILDFRPLTLEDRQTIEKYIHQSEGRLCDYTIGALLMWRNYFDIHICELDDTLYTHYRFSDDTVGYGFPLGGDIASALSAIDSYAHSQSQVLRYCLITDQQLELLRSRYSDIEATSERDWYDYLYNTDDIINLVGKKYRGQRNHINKFNREYPNYDFIQIDDDNVQLAIDFYEAFSQDNTKDNTLAIEEKDMVLEVLNNYSQYSLLGAMLLIGGNVVGMSIGEIVGDTLFVHIEKADTHYLGTYQMLVNLFAKTFRSQSVVYINREEDVGDMGLRTSKMSYRPISLLPKHTCTVNDD